MSSFVQTASHSSMKQACLFFFSFLWISTLRGQSVYFIAIEADNNQPFSVIVGKKNFSSDSRGHLIIPNLVDSTYELAVNFPQGKFGEQKYQVPIRQKDKGFQLKPLGGGQWGLYDWQSLEMINPQPAPGIDPELEKGKRTDDFARLMAGVVNDSAVLYPTAVAPVAKKSPVKPIPEKKDTVAKVVAAPAPPPPVVTMEQKPVKEARSDSAAAPVLTKTEEKKPDPAPPVVIVTKEEKQKDTLVKTAPVIAKADTVAVSPKKVKPEPVKKPAPVVAQRAGIRKLFDNTGKEWRDQIYRDSTGSGTDTVMVKIPLMGNEEKLVGRERENEKEKERETEKQNEATKAIAKEKETANEKENEKETEKENEKVKGTENEIVNEAKGQDSLKLNEVVKDTVAKPAVVVEKPAAVVADTAVRKGVQMINSDCRNFASDNDLDKLRVKMLAETDVEKRIEAARKVFRTRCFSTRQIRALTELFFTDESRYKFFDAAYPYVTDTEPFKALLDQLTDPYYISRFKAMVRMQ